ncbi:hypothetical protein PsYK624_082570 [Phanerochaete sordida]|uniref:Uncharacterized protein n=1 Tax=Phanerochaete sordida TaxID=48140 RepID=A0A9P3GE64_9APHY|nr:hypothetical protein PsYK624_082570 [Phanerochaete sordida]
MAKTQLETATITNDENAFISKSEAKKKYNLSDADMEDIEPIALEHASSCGADDPVYSLHDVENLVRRVQDASSAAGPSSDITKGAGDNQQHSAEAQPAPSTSAAPQHPAQTTAVVVNDDDFYFEDEDDDYNPFNEMSDDEADAFMSRLFRSRPSGPPMRFNRS